jgi:hypothetical protein
MTDAELPAAVPTSEIAALALADELSQRIQARGGKDTFFNDCNMLPAAVAPI